MNMLSGIYHPDKGNIYIAGKPEAINSPMDSIELGIGMIHQHFKLVGGVLRRRQHCGRHKGQA